MSTTPFMTRLGNALSPAEIKEVFCAHLSRLFPFDDIDLQSRLLAEQVEARRARGVSDVFIGLHAEAQTGKTQVGANIRDITGAHLMAYADSLKRVTCEMLGLPDVYMTDDSLKEKIIPGVGLTFREVMQRFATDVVREMDPGIWIRRVAMKSSALLECYPDDPQVIVVTDCRFENESNLIRECGGWMIHIEGEKRQNNKPQGSDIRPTDSTHSSEQPIQRMPEDFVITNNASLSELYNRTESTLKDLFECQGIAHTLASIDPLEDPDQLQSVLSPAS